MSVRIHPTSDVSPKADIGDGTQIWLFCQVRENVKIGKNCIFGKGVYVDSDVVIGDSVKIQNNVSVYVGVTIDDGVFVGPHVCFTNDKIPRAVNPDMSPKSAHDWKVTPTHVKAGAALGANSTIVCGTTVGKWAMVGVGRRRHQGRAGSRARARQPGALRRVGLLLRRAREDRRELGQGALHLRSRPREERRPRAAPGLAPRRRLTMPSIFRKGLFDGHVAIVTGGGSGIGLSTAIALGELGAKVAICGRKKEKLEAAEQKLRAPRHRGASPTHATSARSSRSQAFADAVKEKLGTATILVNNAGGQFPTTAETGHAARLGGGRPQQPERHVLHDAGRRERST